MKTLKSIILFIAIFLSLNLKAQIHHTEYDETIDKLLPKAKKNKLNEKILVLFTQAYHQANQEDHQRIMELKKSGEPDIWFEVYHRLKSIDDRQNKIKTLPNNIKSAMNFKMLKLDEDIRISKEKAELYGNAKANILFKNPTEENLKEVDHLIASLISVNPQSENLDYLMSKSVILKSKHILFRIATPSELYLPDNFAQLALDFENNTIYGIPFDIIPDEDTDYDLMIRIMINEKNISPEKINTATFEEINGDKVAKVTDKTMIKSANIMGDIEFIDVKNKSVVMKTPFDIGSTFVHHYAEMTGNKGACSEETLILLDKQMIDFPSNEALLKDTARKLNQIIKSNYLKK